MCRYFMSQYHSNASYMYIYIHLRMWVFLCTYIYIYAGVCRVKTTAMHRIYIYKYVHKLIAEALWLWNIRSYKSWAIYKNLNKCHRWFHLVGPRKFDVIFLGPNLKSAVTYIQILISYSTIMQTNVSQLQSFRDQNVCVYMYIYMYTSRYLWSQYHSNASYISIHIHIWMCVDIFVCILHVCICAGICWVNTTAAHLVYIYTHTYMNVRLYICMHIAYMYTCR